MISESLIQFETVTQNPSRIFAARYDDERYWLGLNADRTCYWRTHDGRIVADRFRLDQAKLALVAYLNRALIIA